MSEEMIVSDDRGKDNQNQKVILEERMISNQDLKKTGKRVKKILSGVVGLKNIN